MQNNQLTSLVRLIENLDDSQIEELRENLNRKCFKKNTQSKLLPFFLRVIDQETGITKATDRERKLGELLEDRILDQLISSPPQEADRIHCSFNLERRLLKARVLLQKDVYQRSEKHLCTLIRNAKKDEDYEIAIRAERTLISITALHKEDRKYATYLKEIDELEYCNSHKNQAIRLFQELRIRKQRLLTENLSIYLENCCNRLEGLSEKTQSKTIRFIQLYFLKDKLEMAGDPGASIGLIEELQELCPYALSNYLLSSSFELFFDLARLQFSMGQSWMAEFFLKSCLRHLEPRAYVYQQSLELLLFLYHHQDRRNQRDRILEEDAPHLIYADHLSPEDRSKWLFYRACIALEKGRAHQCLKDIDRIYNLEKPKDDLNLNLRILRITALIESSLFDHADLEIEACRKFIARKKLTEMLAQLDLNEVLTKLKQLKQNGYQIIELDGDNPIRFKPALLKYTLFNYANWWSLKHKRAPIRLSFHEDRRTQWIEKGESEPIFL